MGGTSTWEILQDWKGFFRFTIEVVSGEGGGRGRLDVFKCLDEIDL